MIPGQSMALSASAMSTNGSTPRREDLHRLAPVTVTVKGRHGPAAS